MQDKLEKLDNQILEFMKKDPDWAYSIPEIMKGIHLTNREKVIESLTRLKERKFIKLRIKGIRTKVYRLLKRAQS